MFISCYSLGKTGIVNVAMFKYYLHTHRETILNRQFQAWRYTILSKSTIDVHYEHRSQKMILLMQHVANLSL